MRVFVATVLACLSMSAFAFDDFDYRVANIDVLRDKNVQKELGVTEAQRSTMNQYADKYSKTMEAKVQEYQKAKKTPDQAFVTFGNTQLIDLRTKVLKTLTAAQVKRLRELTIQAAGPRALLDKVVATRVGLTTTEYNQLVASIRDGDRKIGAIKKQVSDKVRAKYKNQKQPKTKKEADELQAKLNKDLTAEMAKHDAEMKAIIQAGEKQATAIVKPQYRKTLNELCGKPFNPPKPTGGSQKPATGKKG